MLCCMPQTGSLPPELQDCLQLQALQLASANLSGPIPFSGGLPMLKLLDLAWNQLTGPLPAGLPPSIMNLTVSHNKLSGQLPIYDDPMLENSTYAGMCSPCRCHLRQCLRVTSAACTP